MASDRRLTTTQRGRVIDQSDRATKSTLLWGQMLMGYTGVAILDRIPMEFWAAERLAGVRPNEAPEVLANAMNDYYSKHRELQGVPHHFMMAGFAYNPARSPASWPMGVEVGNCTWVATGDRVTVSPDVTEFTARRKHVGNQGVIVGAVGAPYSLSGLRRLRREVKFAARSKPNDPALVFEKMVEFTRTTAASSGGTVGDAVTVSSLPRSVIPRRIEGWSIPLSPEGMAGAKLEPHTRTYYPGDSAETTQWMPAIVYPDLQLAGMAFAVGSTAPNPPDFPSG